MERKLNQPQRLGKNKISHHPSDLFALGSKQTTQSKEPEKRSISGANKPSWESSSSSKVGSSLKRDVTSAAISSLNPSKKPKITVGRNVPSSLSTPQSLETWELHAVDCEPFDLVRSVLLSIDNQNDDYVNLLCGALKTIRSHRWKFDLILYLSLAYLGRMRPQIFSNQIITEALGSILKRDCSSSIKPRSLNVVQTLAANLLFRGYHDKKDWPIAFVKLYIDDALNERNWVDSEDCKLFVENVLTAFDTLKPPSHLLQPEGTVPEHKMEVNSPVVLSDDEFTESPPTSIDQLVSNLPSDGRVSRRYLNTESIEGYIVEIVKEQIIPKNRALDTVTRNALKLMAVACGLVEIRLLAVARLELWLHNSKLVKPAQELLAYLCYNCSSKTAKDLEVVSHFVKIRLKSKPLCSVYLNCFRSMLRDEAEDLQVLMKYTIHNELANARNPNNISMVVLMFQEHAEKSSRVLAEIYKDFILNREDYLRPLRLFLREVVRAMRYDLNLETFCYSLVAKDRQFAHLLGELDFKDRVLNTIVDVICLCMLLCISPQVKDAAIACARGDKKDLHVLQSYQLQISRIQFEVIRWMEKIVPVLYKPNANDYLTLIRKILFLENNLEPYVKVDSWPPDSERGVFFKLATDVRVHQNTLIRLMKIGLQKTCPITAPNVLELCEQLVKRSSDITHDYYPLLHVEKPEIVDYLFRLTEYHYPDNIHLPAGYVPPNFAVVTAYWKAWGILLIIAAHNPVSIGAMCWDRYPMLRALMEMCITNQFIYPPPTLATSQSYVDLSINDSEMEMMEKLEIIELEKHLAAATTQNTITEQTSLLIRQLIRYDPGGPARRPPFPNLETFKQLNKSHGLGHLFCRSREPDFLMDIIQRQGTSQSMPWLADLVENSESVSLLPVQCLCEFLLSADGPDQEKHMQLLQHLQNLVTNPETPPQTACEVLDYFLRRLSSPIKTSRVQAIRGLQLLLNSSSGDNILDKDFSANQSDWLLKQLPLLPHFEEVKMQVVSALRGACQIDTNPETIVYYLHFLAMHTTITNTEEELTELVNDLSQLVVERTLIMNSIVYSDLHEEGLNSLLSIFCCYLSKVRINREYTYAELANPDLVLIVWATEEQSYMIINVVHAMVILLSYNPVESELSKTVIDAWFPVHEERPKGYIMEDNNELKETVLYPPWLKLRMIRSPVQCLVDAALQDLHASQLILFIQSFGLPLESMSKCLRALDHAVVHDPSFTNGVMEKSYMALCLAVQQLRGVKEGRIFVEALSLYDQTYPLETIYYNWQNGNPHTIIRGTSEVCEKEQPGRKTVKQIFDEIFGIKSLEYNLFANAEYMSNLLRVTAIELKQNKISNNSILFEVIKYFYNVESEVLTKVLSLKIYILLPLLHLLLYNCSNVVKPFLVVIFTKIVANINSLGKQLPEMNILARLIHNSLLKNDTKVKQTITSALKILKESRSNELEYVMEDLIHNETDTKGHKVHLMNALCILLMEIESEFPSTSSRGINEKVIYSSQLNGMLIDWVAAIEPDLIGCTSDIQMQLLFSKQAGMNGFRPYLLTLLTHQASWAVLNNCVQHLLSTMSKRYDPSAVLDFLSTLISNPKLWQGRDKFLPKHYKPEDVLELTVYEIFTVLDYILYEAVNIFEETGRSTTIIRIGTRLPLLLHCLRNDQTIIKMVVQFVFKKFNETDIKVNRRKVLALFLIQFYLQLPVIIIYEKKLAVLLDNANLRDIITSCNMDTMCQSIFTALASTPAAKDWHKRCTDLELCARKLAAVHPNLVLRQFSMIVSCMQGRTHLDFNLFRSRYHLALFNQIMGVAELLQPLIFRKEHENSLHDLLNSYFSIFKIHFKSVKDLQVILSRFIHFLQCYVSYDAKRALSYMQQHSEIIQELYNAFPLITYLKNIATGVSLLYRKEVDKMNPRNKLSSYHHKTIDSIKNKAHDEEAHTKENMCLQMGIVTMTLTSPRKELPNAHWRTLLETLSKIQGDEVFNTLQEIDHITSKKPYFLENAIVPLCLTLSSPSANVRNLAHMLLLRYLKNRPHTTSSLDVCFREIIKCLYNTDPDIVTAVLDRIPEYIICLQEHSLIILQTLFTLGMNSQINTTTHIAKCITILKLQDGN